MAWSVASVAVGAIVFAFGEAVRLGARLRAASRLTQLVVSAVVVVAALAGGVLYLLWPSDVTWWVGGWFALPAVVVLVAGRTGGSAGDGGDAGAVAPP